MLEDNEPGELPLMRNLHALKQPRESPALKARSRKSPVVESASSITHEPNFASLEAFDHDWDAVQEHDIMLPHGEGGIRRDGSVRRSDGRIRKHAHSRTPLRTSPHLNSWDARGQLPYEIDMESRMSWDLGGEVPAGIDANTAEWHIRRNSRAHDGIFDEIHKGVRPVSHDRTTEWVSSSANEAFGSGSVNNYHSGFFPAQHQDDNGRLKALQKTSKLEQGHKQWRQNDQILSPLILNPNSDMHRSVHSNSLFTLEDPIDAEEEQGVGQDWHYRMAHQREASGMKAGAPSRSPLSPHNTRRSHRKHAVSKSDALISPQMTNASNMSRQIYSEYSRVAPAEFEFFEYEVEAMELPGKKESGKALQKSKYLKQSKGVAGSKEERRESSVGMRRIASVNAGHQAEQVVSSKHPAGSPEVEPLPLLTELEDYNGSEEYGATSVDGEIGRLSMSELHGELELVPCNTSAPDRDNAGRLVKIADAEHLQLSVQQDCKELALCDYKPRNFSQKYRPKVFEEVVGQHIVAQALSNAILKCKIAPVYLFQGSRGTGKTSAARIFASALLCMSVEGQRPCGACRECVSVATGKCSEVREVDAASNNGVERVKVLLEETISAPPLFRYKVFIIDECHVLTTETWNCLLKILEEPPMNVVFILITTDADQLPRTVVSRCQKFPFPKIKDSEIVKRLQKLAALEDLAIDAETLQLIASRSEGSLRDAETILDQVSLLGQQINSSTVYQLVGSVSDERLLGLLNSALVADTISTVRRARELVDSGVEPLSLMSRLATLITDILAGTFKFSDKQRKGFFRKQSLSEMRLERLRLAMKTLSEAEKQLRTSNDRSTWLIAALLQLGPERSLMFAAASYVGSSISQSPIALDENEAVDFEHRSSDRQTWPDGDVTLTQNLNSEPVPMDKRSGLDYGVHVHERPQYWTTEPVHQDASHGKGLSLTQGETSSKPMQGTEKSSFPIELDEGFNSSMEQRLSPAKLNDIWCKVVERCQSNPLRQLLYASVRLISISISEVDAVVHLEVCNPDDNASCGRSQTRIANLFEMVLGFPVEIKMSLSSLPTERESSKTPEDKSHVVPGNNRQTHLHKANSKGYEWENQANMMKPRILKNSNVTESFPGNSHRAQPRKDMHPDSSTAMWRHMPSSEGERLPRRQEGMGVTVPCESEEARRYALSKAGASGGQQARRQVSRNDVLGDVNGYHNDVKEGSSEEERERELEEIELLSPEFNDLDDDPHVKDWRARHSTYEGPVVIQAGNIDARRSSDVDLQRRKGSHLSMVRRLSMRSRIRSLPSSDPNSPDRVGANLSSANGNEKGKDGQPTVEDAELAGDAAEPSITTQRKGKLKGGFARFFQGKLSKQGSDHQ